jgi:cyclopropane fatty-acyl-phospholipid synthase-like methyltransferase
MTWIHKLFFQWMYLSKPRWDTGITPPEVMALLENHPAGRALDLGCGTGTNAITLAQHGWQVTGVDYIRSAIRQAKRKARQANVRVDFYQQDVTRLKNIHGPFDLVLDIGCFHNLTEQDKRIYVQNLSALLETGGTFLMYGFFKQTPDSSENGISAVDLDLLASHLKLVDRQDGTERGTRPSMWLTYVK